MTISDLEDEYTHTDNSMQYSSSLYSLHLLKKNRNTQDLLSNSRQYSILINDKATLVKI